MSNIKVGDVVKIRDMAGFAIRTINRFSGRCCKVESLSRGLSCENAHLRIIGCDDEPFNSITVRVSRLVKIRQLPKGTKQEPRHEWYWQKDGDVFVMTGVQDVEVAGTLLELKAGERFRIKRSMHDAGYSWVLEYLDVEQNSLHYTDGKSEWINELLVAGVIEQVKIKAPEFGPVPVDDWSYNSTTLEGLALGEVAELRSTISDATTGRIMFTHIRKADVGCWVRINPKAHHVAGYLSARGVSANPINLGWIFLRYSERAFKDAAFLTNGNVVYITAFEYPAMRPDLEDSFPSEINR